MGLLIPTGKVKVKKLTRADFIRRRKERERLKRVEHYGRPQGKSHGTWVDDLVALRKIIILCHLCKHKFDNEKHNYYFDRKFPYVMGRCSACRSFASQGALYIHESALAEPGGNLLSHQMWTPT